MEHMTVTSMLEFPSEYAEDIRKDAVRHLWHHWYQASKHADTGPLMIVEGRGAVLRDINGKEYIDTSGGLASAVIGHGRAEMAEAIAAQVKRLQYINLSMGYSNVPASLLATKLAEITPGDLEVTFFVCSGAEANDTAFKMARQVQLRRGFHNRYKIISQNKCYHGTTFGALSASGRSSHRTPNEPVVPGFSYVPQPYCYRCDLGLTYPACGLLCAKMLGLEIEMQGPETVAAFVAAPITCTQMVAVPPPEYWPMVREICDTYGVLLIADEIFVGFGRSGKLFSSNHWDLQPDIMTVAKGITSGYLPLSGAIARRTIADTFSGDEKNQFIAAGTYSGHPVCCAAALANLEIIEREKLVQRSAEMGKRLLDGLRELESRPQVGNVGGLGLLAHIELVANRQTKERMPNEAVSFMHHRMQELGLYNTHTGTGNVLKFHPPLVIEPEQVDRLVAIVREALNDMAVRFPIH